MGEIFWIVICVILTLIIIGTILWKVINDYLNVNYRMALYADIPYSMKEGIVHLNFINVKNFPQFWDVHEDNLKLYAMGTEIKNVKFLRTPDVPNGLKIRYPENFTHMEFLALSGAVKYNRFEISPDGGVTKKQINSVKDNISNKIKMKLTENSGKTMDLIVSELKSDILKSDKYYYLTHEEHYGKEDALGVMSHFNEGKTTPTSLRYQLLLPDDHPAHAAGFDPLSSKTQFFYIYDGYMYELKIKFLEQIENFYEWDFIDLEPGKVYPAVSYTVNGKHYSPSTALYGITRNADGTLPTIDEAQIAVPPKGAKKYPMWTEETSIKYMGEHLTKINYDVIAKKHYEYDDEIGFVSLQEAHTVYENYPWLKTGKKIEE